MSMCSTSSKKGSSSSASSSKGNRALALSSIFVILLAIIIRHPQPDLPAELPSIAAKAVKASPESIDAGHPLDGINVVITGSTSGIGLGLARYLHGLGATIIALGRSPSKLAKLQQELDGGRSSSDRCRVETFVADLTDLASIASAANDVASRFDTIDYLVNNAGIHYNSDVILSFRTEHSTPQGYDVAFEVNYLSHFLLTEKLLPLLENSARESPRIIQMASSFHWLSDGSDMAVMGNNPPRASLGDAKSIVQRSRSYANSKLAQIMHARALSRRLSADQSKVRVVSVCPGWVGTNVAGGSGFNKILLQTIAYPNDGFGLASTLDAMFLPDAGRDEHTDFFVNSAVFDLLGTAIENMGLVGKKWPAQTGFRDMVCWVLAVALLWTQKFASGAQYSTSSPESYNNTVQEELYEWSKGVVSEWL
mmetsp:Transcript_20699/g.46173  ORF Transcript_20699/g.46173 Transcript_20699/m.46173 type:complete len:423 (-) Transcript_20699:63-1331(-)